MQFARFVIITVALAASGQSFCFCFFGHSSFLCIHLLLQPYGTAREGKDTSSSSSSDKTNQSHDKRIRRELQQGKTSLMARHMARKKEKKEKKRHDKQAHVKEGSVMNRVRITLTLNSNP
jgi:hypothetical protein